MAQDGYEIRNSIELLTELRGKLETEAGYVGLNLEAGWGVFMDLDGIVRMPRRVLRSVWEEREAADAEAAKLEETEGEHVLEVEEDPDSSAYSTTHFRVGYVTLKSLDPEVTFVRVYEPAQEPEQS